MLTGNCAGPATHKELGRGERAAAAAADWRQPQRPEQRAAGRAAAHNPADDRHRAGAAARWPARLSCPGPGAAQQQPVVGQCGWQRPEEQIKW